ncbi:MAG: pseudouridine synthase [Immundisolibacteraceae bacterium]|nr:pseudouridine synthase [Immundisolibacteraceae bacterium]
MSQVILFNKPYGVLSQFTDEAGHPGLGRFLDKPGFYPAGRLDRDSEGLLVLTDDGALQHRISHPKKKMAKTYWVQVEGCADENAIKQLVNGVNLKDGMTRPALIKSIPEPNRLWHRDPPIRQRKNKPTSWLEITIKEGKNRQIRRMTAAVGLPTLRLIRYSIGPWCLGSLQPKDWQTIEDQE